MVLKGLPDSYKPFVVVVTQSDKQQTFTEFKAALRSFEETECNRTKTNDDLIMKMMNHNNGFSSDITCYKCGKKGHIARHCGSEPNLVYVVVLHILTEHAAVRGETILDRILGLTKLPKRNILLCLKRMYVLAT